MPTTNYSQFVYFSKAFLKRYYPLAIIHLIGLLYFFPIQLFLNRNWVPGIKYSPFHDLTFFQSILHLNKQPFTLVALFIITLIYAILATRSLNHKPEFTRLFSLPLNRKMLFVGNMVASMLLFSIPILITALSLFAMRYALHAEIQNALGVIQMNLLDNYNGLDAALFSYDTLLQHWLQVHLGFGLICLGTALVAHVLFTFSQLQLILTLVIQVLPTGFILLFDFLISSYLLGYGPPRINSDLVYSSPAFYFLNLNVKSYRWPNIMDPPLWFWFIFALYLVGSFAFAYWLFSNSKLERKEDLLVIPELRLPFTILGTLGASLLCGMIVILITQDKIMGMGAYLLGLLIGFVCTQMIIQQRLVIHLKKKI